MKILMIVTLVSPLGEYGGPLRVAVNQSTALIGRGHSVTIAGSYHGYQAAPARINSIETRLFRNTNVLPRSGFAGLVAPGLLVWLLRNIRSFDIAHVHMGRDLVTLPAAIVAGLRRVPYVLQTHGMVDHSSRLLAKPLDMGLTVPALRRAQRVLYLNDKERSDLLAVAGRKKLTLTELPNGVPLASPAVESTGPSGEVLFLSRLAPRKRANVFVEAAAALHTEFPEISFRLVGPDEGCGNEISALIGRVTVEGADVYWEGPIPPSETSHRMARASIFALPSINEPYPMAVLEAMSVGLPIIITHSCGLAPLVQSSRAGIVVDHGQESFNRALRSLLSDRAMAADMGMRGRQAVRHQLSMDSVVETLEDAYRG